MIKIFEHDEKNFDSNGLGVLSDAISCLVNEELNNVFELSMEYPVDGIHFDKLKQRRILLVPPNPYDEPQPFRIYEISTPIDGTITVKAEHISYDLSGIPIMPVLPNYAVGPQGCFDYMTTNSVVECPFTFSTDMSSDRTMAFAVPRSIRAMMGTDENSILSVFGGEYKYDRFKIELLQQRGSDRGKYIRYGKNLTDFTQEDNISDVYTGVMPYWYKEDDGFMYLDEKVVPCPGDYNYTKILPLDLSSEFDEMPPQHDLRSKAQEYISANKIGVPKVTLTVSYLDSPDEWYGEVSDAAIGDIIHVRYTEMNVSADSRCIATVYDAIEERYESVTLGSPEVTLVDQLTGITTSITTTDRHIIANQALIEKTDKEIRLYVGQTETDIRQDVAQYKQELSSEFDVKAGQITSTVSKYQEDVNGKITTMQSTIDQTPSSIDMSVSDTNSIASIRLSVTDKKGNVLVDKSIGSIDLRGFVTFTGLADGTTTIDGGCLKTGTISCDLLSGGSINGQTMYGGSIEGASGNFSDSFTAGKCGWSQNGGLIHFENGAYIDLNSDRIMLSKGLLQGLKVDATGVYAYYTGTAGESIVTRTILNTAIANAPYVSASTLNNKLSGYTTDAHLETRVDDIKNWVKNNFAKK